MRSYARLAIMAGLSVTLVASAPALAGFYDVTAADLKGPPGSLIRLEGVPKVKLSTAMVYRILYRSTGLDGKGIAVSGLVVAPDRTPPRDGWPVIAWAHPTTGIARKCAPSMLPDPVATISGIYEMIERDYVVVATDYPGLGGPGVHPYMVGTSEARAVLDSVRAVHEMRETRARSSFVVWGHSQGGHAALWTGELATSYAPELRLLGVAAAAPATELGKLFEDDLATMAGKILSSLVLVSWSKVFGAPIEKVVAKRDLPDVEKAGAECINLLVDEFADLQAGKAMERRFLTADPTKVSPWMELIAKNVPTGAGERIPVFIAQGTADKVVDPPITVNFVRKLCARGNPVEFVEYRNVDHDKIAKDSAGKALSWMGDRLAGRPAPSNCGR